jgi:hypothetical protein
MKVSIEYEMQYSFIELKSIESALNVIDNNNKAFSFTFFFFYKYKIKSET